MLNGNMGLWPRLAYPKTVAASRLSFEASAILMGRRNLGTFEVTEYQPNKKYGFKSLTGPVHSETSYSLENMNGWTQIQISICVSVPNFFQITDSLVELTLERQLEQDISRLKEILRKKQQASGCNRMPSNTKTNRMIRKGHRQ